MSLSSTIASRFLCVMVLRTVTNLNGPDVPILLTLPAMLVVCFAGIPKESGACVHTRPPANIRSIPGCGGAGMPWMGWPSGPRSRCGQRFKKYTQCHRDGNGSPSAGGGVSRSPARASADSRLSVSVRLMEVVGVALDEALMVVFFLAQHRRRIMKAALIFHSRWGAASHPVEYSPCSSQHWRVNQLTTYVGGGAIGSLLDH